MGIRSRTTRFANLMERVGLAVADASSGLFVAGHLAKAGVEVLGSVAVVFAILVCDAIGDGCAGSAYILIFVAVPHVIGTMVDG